MMHTPSQHSRSRRPRRSRRRSAFSLMELIVAVTIMAILAAVVVPRLTRWIGHTNKNRAKADAETISQQVRMYMSAHGMSTLPQDFDLIMLTEGDDPFLTRNQLKDPWGNDYQIRVPGQVNLDYDIYSLGADGSPGGEGEAADIVNGATD